VPQESAANGGAGVILYITILTFSIFKAHSAVKVLFRKCLKSIVRKSPKSRKLKWMLPLQAKFSRFAWEPYCKPIPLLPYFARRREKKMAGK
jgi:hypothetical protein